MMAKERSEVFSHHTFDLIKKKDAEISKLERQNTELRIEIERLKSWEHFKVNLDACIAFNQLSEEHQNMIMLMMDGMKYRKEKNNE